METSQPMTESMRRHWLVSGAWTRMRAMTSPTVHPAQRIVDLGFGFILPGALSSVAELGVAGKLAQGPRSAAA